VTSAEIAPQPDLCSVVDVSGMKLDEISVHECLDLGVWTQSCAGLQDVGRTESAVVAFEVDDYQLAYRCGWSVLVVGRAEVTHYVAMARKALDAGLEPGSLVPRRVP
jgi:hypothetical protein